MRVTVRPIANPRKDARSWLLLAGVVFLWAVARVMVPTSAGAALPWFGLPSCPLRSLTGIPCPFCGITTGSSWLVRGHLSEAWSSNILSPGLMIGALLLGCYVVVFRLAAGRLLFLEVTPRARRFLWLCGLALIAVSWGFNLLRTFR